MVTPAVLRDVRPIKSQILRLSLTFGDLWAIFFKNSIAKQFLSNKTKIIAFARNDVFLILFFFLNLCRGEALLQLRAELHLQLRVRPQQGRRGGEGLRARRSLRQPLLQPGRAQTNKRVDLLKILCGKSHRAFKDKKERSRPPGLPFSWRHEKVPAGNHEAYLSTLTPPIWPP